MTIFEAITADHETQRRLIDAVVDTEGDSDERRLRWAELRSELEAHAGAEERYFYVPLMEHDMTQDKARHSVAEHKELDDFIEQIDGYDMSGPQWIRAAKDLRHRLLHHLDEEETEVYPVAGRVLDDDEKASLGTEYESDMARRRDGD